MPRESPVIRGPPISFRSKYANRLAGGGGGGGRCVDLAAGGDCGPPPKRYLNAGSLSEEYAPGDQKRNAKAGTIFNFYQRLLFGYFVLSHDMHTCFGHISLGHDDANLSRSLGFFRNCLSLRIPL